MNGIYLFLLLREIKKKLVGLFIDALFAKERIVQCVFGSRALFISLYPQAPAIFLARKNTKGFEKLQFFNQELYGANIRDLIQPDFMPMLRILTSKRMLDEQVELILNISLYREAPNIGIKKNNRTRALFRRYIEKKPKAPITDLNKKNLELFYKEHKELLPDLLFKKFEGIDKYFARELTLDNTRELLKIIDGQPVKPRLISVHPLNLSLFSRDYIQKFTTFNSAFEFGVRRFCEERLKQQQAVRKRIQIKNLKKQITRLQAKQVSLKEIEDYRIFGELILMNLVKIKKNYERIDKIKVLNPYTNKFLEIELRKDKSPQENAQLYFNKYKKLKRSQPILKERIKQLQKKLQKLECSDEISVSEVTVRHKRTSKKMLPFRVFKFDSGSVVYIGKNAASNEELTFKYARPDDYFFHVRGIEGSHVILKPVSTGRHKPLKKDMEKAAALALYFSKARKQKRVPVSYTQRKYLKKNKKGKKGSVILMREEVLFVETALNPETENLL